MLAAQLGEELDMAAVRSGQLTPMFFGSAMSNFGVQLFLETFIGLASPPGWVPMLVACWIKFCLFQAGFVCGMAIARIPSGLRVNPRTNCKGARRHAQVARCWSGSAVTICSCQPPVSRGDEVVRLVIVSALQLHPCGRMF